MLDITDPYQAFCLDEALAYLGNSIQSEIDQIEGKNSEDSRRKKEQVLRRFLFPEDKPQKTGFADPASFFS